MRDTVDSKQRFSDKPMCIRLKSGSERDEAVTPQWQRVGDRTFLSRFQAQFQNCHAPG